MKCVAREGKVVCVNDFMAVGVLRELREQELRIPQDVSVEVQRNGEK